MTNFKKNIQIVKDFFIHKAVRLLEELDLEWTLGSTFYASYIGHGHSDEKLDIDSYELHGCY